MWKIQVLLLEIPTLEEKIIIDFVSKYLSEYEDLYLDQRSVDIKNYLLTLIIMILSMAKTDVDLR